MDDRVQHGFPRRPPGKVRRCQLAEPAAIDQGELEMRLESLLQRVEDGYDRSLQILSSVVPRCRRVSDEDELVLRRPSGKGGRTADQEYGCKSHRVVLHQTQIPEELLSWETRHLHLAAAGSHTSLQIRDVLGVQIP